MPYRQGPSLLSWALASVQRRNGSHRRKGDSRLEGVAGTSSRMRSWRFGTCWRSTSCVDSSTRKASSERWMLPNLRPLERSHAEDSSERYSVDRCRLEPSAFTRTTLGGKVIGWNVVAFPGCVSNSFSRGPECRVPSVAVVPNGIKLLYGWSDLSSEMASVLQG